MTTALSKQQTSDLRACEQVIEKGIGTFRIVGKALAKIRDDRLYKSTHKSFEAYCSERWDFGRSYAARLIQAADVPEVLPSGQQIQTERQARKYLDEQHHPVAGDSDDDQDADGGAVRVTGGQLAEMEPDPVGVSEQGAAAKFRERLIGWTETQFNNIDDLSWQVAASVFLQLGDECETWN
jgi:hypothetical protein